MRYIIYLLLALLLSMPAWAGQDYNEAYSFKDFTDQTFVDVDSATEFDGTYIKGSSFYQTGDELVQVFPDDMVNVTFEDCNLDNVYFSSMDRFKWSDTSDTTKLPRNIRFINCTFSRIINIDGEDWHCDIDGNPINKVTIIEDE